MYSLMTKNVLLRIHSITYHVSKGVIRLIYNINTSTFKHTLGVMVILFAYVRRADANANARLVLVLTATRGSDNRGGMQTLCGTEQHSYLVSYPTIFKI